MCGIGGKLVLVGALDRVGAALVATVAPIGTGVFESSDVSGQRVTDGPPAFLIDGDTGDVIPIETATLDCTDIAKIVGCDYVTVVAISAGDYTQMWVGETAELTGASINHRATAIYKTEEADVFWGTVVVVKEGVVS